MIRRPAVAALLATFAMITILPAAPGLVGTASPGHHAVRAVALCGGGMSQGSDSC